MFPFSKILMSFFMKPAFNNANNWLFIKTKPPVSIGY